VETIVVPNINVVERGGLIGYVAKLGSRSSGVSTRRHLNRSSALLAATTKVVGILQMVYTSLITIICGNKTIYRPLMNLMAIEGVEM
jgi:hypothetical protein